MLRNRVDRNQNQTSIGQRPTAYGCDLSEGGRRTRGRPSEANQVAEELGSDPSGAKALEEYKGCIAALKALRHPKIEFFSKLPSPQGFLGPYGTALSRALSKPRLAAIPTIPKSRKVGHPKWQ
jgi:hypothetical protein